MIVVLTYNVPHRKTQDLLYHLKLKTNKEVIVIGSPMKYKKKYKPLIQHRPNEVIKVNNMTLCNKLGFMYEEVSNEKLFDKLKQIKPKLVLVGGYGLIDAEIVRDFFVVNAHPGKLPDVRGLDALKWAIYHGKDIGVTLHLVDENSDGGLLIQEEIVPIFPYDTFHSLAYRQYETEIKLLSDSIELLNGIKRKSELKKINIDNTISNRRMDHEKEKELYNIFNERLKKISIMEA